jgi:O-antigen/teichoic acid export membrane protein
LSGTISRAFAASAFLLPGLAVFTFALADYQATGRRVKFGGLSIGRFLCMTLAGMSVVLFAQRSAVAFLGGAAIGVTLLMLPYLWTNLPKHPFRAGSRTVVFNAFHFGLGMWFQYLAGKVLRVGDRFVVGAFIGATAVAIYGAEYSLLFGTMALVVTPLVTVVTPRAYATADREGDAAFAALLSKILNVYVPVMFLAVGGLFVVAPQFFGAVVPAGYGDHLRPDVILALEVAAALHGATLILNIILAVKRRTFISAKLFAILAIANIACNLLLVPVIGISGAVYANLLSYSALLVFTIIWSRRFVAVRLPVRSGAMALTAVAGLGVISALAEDMNRWAAVSLESAIVLGVFLVLIAMTPMPVMSMIGRAIHGPEPRRVQVAAESL